MAGLVARQLNIDLSQVGFESAAEIRMVLRRATVADSFIIIPENFRVKAELDGGIGEAELLPTTYGSVYECTLLDTNKVKLTQFFFEMPDEDSNLSDLIKLTAWPVPSNSTPVDTPSKLIDLTDVVEDDPDSGVGKYLTEIAPVSGMRQFGFEFVLPEHVSGLVALLDGKLDIDGYPARDSLIGTESIPLADGIKEATTPDQLADYVNQVLDLPAQFADKLDVGGGYSRSTIVVTTASIAAADYQTLSFEAFPSFDILAIEVDGLCRVRLYPSAAKRDDDITRLFRAVEPQGCSIQYEFKSKPDFLSMDAQFNAPVKSNVGSTIFATVENTGIVSQAYTITLTVLQKESS